MTSKKALDNLRFDVLMLHNIDYIRSNNECDIIKKDLDRLEKLEKVIDFLKLNFNMSLDSKLRISDDSECVQTFITYLPENTTIDEMYEVLKEVLENENNNNL